MGISPISGNFYNAIQNYKAQNLQIQASINAMKKAQQIDQLIPYMLYKQTGMTLKLVRMLGDLYQGTKLDELA